MNFRGGVSMHNCHMLVTITNGTLNLFPTVSAFMHEVTALKAQPLFSEKGLPGF